MERRIDLTNLDLDAAAMAVAVRRPQWEQSGLTAHPVTWMDADAEWPRPLVADRADVGRPMSLGLRVERPSVAEAEVVLYAGGWADVAVGSVSENRPQLEHVELDSADEFGPLLDRVLASLI